MKEKEKKERGEKRNNGSSGRARRRKAVIFTGLTCVFVCGFVFAAVGAPPPTAAGAEGAEGGGGAGGGKTWYVDDDGGQNFTRIQAAVVAASDGDTIFVYEGYYNEIVTLDKELTVLGENKTTTVIDGNKIKDVVKITA
ncbi:MAG TPA: hypothetical protein ENG23_04360, partial [Methanomicrobia archaeon]|nr:hypothetical protein [Methanomicrobia archaeon]